MIHACYLTCVKDIKVLDGGELIHAAEPVSCSLRFRIAERNIEHHLGHLIANAILIPHRFCARCVQAELHASLLGLLTIAVESQFL